MKIATRTALLARTTAQRLLAARVPTATSSSSLSGIRHLSGNITYSGGQAIEGQGGFYSSGGARASSAPSGGTEGREFLLALATDVETITQVMEEVDRLEGLLLNEGDSVSSKSIELKGSIKKLITAKEFVEALDRLEVEGAPVWGLSADEREMIVLAREKMNNC